MQSVSKYTHSNHALHLFFKCLLVVCFLFSCYPSFSQHRKIDSLIFLLKQDKEDTNKVKRLNNISREYINIGRYDTALHYDDIALQLAQKLNFSKGIANTSNIIGIIYTEQGDYPKAQDYYLKALKIDEELNDKIGKAKRFGNIGNVYRYQHDYQKSLDYYFKALRMAEEIGDKQIQANNLGNIGVVYYKQADTTEVHFDRSKRDSLYKKSLDCYFNALKMYEELGNKNGIATTLDNIGSVYKEQHDYPKSLDYYLKALKMDEKVGNKNGIARHLSNIGSIYSLTKKYEQAEKYLLQALAIGTAIGDLDGVMQREQELTRLYEKMGNPAKALEHYKKSVTAKDTLLNADKNKEITRKAMKYEFDKKEAAAKAEQEKKDAVQKSEERKQKIVLILTSGFLLLTLIFAVLILRSLRITRKQKNIIEIQKHKVEEHQKEIIDSITYAKRLQEAILPPLDFIRKHLPDSFILYQPKDIVAGDFYWLEVMDSTIFVAAADCTGHGVSGAMISVVCSNALNRTIKEFGLRDTGKILDKVTELVLETFEKSDKDVKDGMDISLMAINKTTRQIQWSGANNLLCYVAKGEIKEIKPDKQPIGKHDNRKPFTTHIVDHHPPTTYYLLTDGYVDQFGGPKGKKFKYKQLEEKLLAISGQGLEDQKKILEHIFTEWKGNLEQVDDVCIVGIRM